MQQELDLLLTPHFRSAQTHYLLLQRRKTEIHNSFILSFLFFCMHSASIAPLTFTSHSFSLVLQELECRQTLGT